MLRLPQRCFPRSVLETLAIPRFLLTRFNDLPHSIVVQADSSPIVQESGLYLSVKLDRHFVPVEDVKHNSKTVFLRCDGCYTRDTCATDFVLSVFRSDEQVFQEQTTSLKCWQGPVVRRQS